MRVGLGKMIGRKPDDSRQSKAVAVPPKLRLRATVGEAAVLLVTRWRQLALPAAALAAAAAAFEYRLLDFLFSFLLGQPGPAISSASLLAVPVAVLSVPVFVAAQRAALGAGEGCLAGVPWRLLGALARLIGLAFLICLPALVATSFETAVLIGSAAGFHDSVSPEFRRAFNLILPVAALWPATAMYFSRYLLVLPAAVAGRRLALADTSALLAGNRIRMSCLAAHAPAIVVLANLAPALVSYPRVLALSPVVGIIDSIGLAGFSIVIGLSYRTLAAHAGRP